MCACSFGANSLLLTSIEGVTDLSSPSPSHTHSSDGSSTSADALAHAHADPDAIMAASEAATAQALAWGSSSMTPSAQQARLSAARVEEERQLEALLRITSKLVSSSQNKQEARL